MSFKDLQREYDNMCEPDYPDDNPYVIEWLEKVHDEESYFLTLYEDCDEAIQGLLLKVAKNENDSDDLLQLAKLLREHYANSLDKFIDINYCEYNEKWLNNQSE